jgi:hypothetical protein
MAKSDVFTASGVCQAASGGLWAVNVTKVATGAGVVRVWDNPTTNSGKKLFEGDGLVQGSFCMTDGNGGPTTATQGLYVELGGTTNATVVIVHD